MYIVIVVVELRDCNCVYRLAPPWLMFKILWTIGLPDLAGYIYGGESCITLASLSWIIRPSEGSFYRALGPARWPGVKIDLGGLRPTYLDQKL